VCDRTLNPVTQRALRRNAGGLDEYHRPHRLAGELHQPDMPLVQRSVGANLAEPEHQLVSHDPAGHMTRHEEGQPAEHLALGHAGHVDEERPHAACQILVVGHHLNCRATPSRSACGQRDTARSARSIHAPDGTLSDDDGRGWVRTDDLSRVRRGDARQVRSPAGHESGGRRTRILGRPVPHAPTEEVPANTTFSGWARRVSNLRPLACEAWRSRGVQAMKYL
jgi:hypothetical protein